LWWWCSSISSAARDLGQDLVHQPGVDEQPDAADRVGRLEQLHELALHAFGADDDRRAQARHGLERPERPRTPAAGEAGGAQHAQRIVAEAHVGVAGRAQDAGEKVLDASGRIDECGYRQAQRHRADREVRRVRSASRESPNSTVGLRVAVVAVGAVRRDLDLGPRAEARGGDPWRERGDSALPDGPAIFAPIVPNARPMSRRRSERLHDPQDVVGPGVGRQVEVVRLAPEERVAHRTPTIAISNPACANAAPRRAMIGEVASAPRRSSPSAMLSMVSAYRRSLRGPGRAAQESRERQFPHARKQVGAQRRGIHLEQLRDRVGEDPHGKVPSHAPTRAARAGRPR
jgi:hypothetical protein